jgi:hypothetical protein
VIPEIIRSSHTQALAREGWGRSPKDKEASETGNLSLMSIGQALILGSENYYTQKFAFG